MATVITIGGVAADVPRALVPRRLVCYVKGGIPSLSFSVRGGALPGLPDPYLAKEITAEINGTLRFAGDVVSVSPEFAPGLGWVHTYQCLGLRNRGDLVPHTDGNDGSDSSTYNASADNQGDDYRADRAGRTVGEVLADVLTSPANAAALDSLGLGAYATLSPPTLPAATLADLAALTLIPPAPVRFGGEQLLGAVEALLSSWAPNVCLDVAPDGTLRFRDLRSFTPATLTLGTDPVRPSGLSRDTSHCFSRVLVRGERVAEMFLLSLSNGGLSESPFAHDGLTVAQAKAAWTPSDYQQPGLPAGQASATATLTTGAVSGVTVSNQGYGYASAPAVSFTGGGGSGATATATLTGGKVTSVAVGAGGSGYTTAPTVVIEAPGGAASDAGTCACGSTTTVTVTSANPAVRWASDFWDQTSGGRHGTVFLSYGAGAGLTTFAQRRVVANTALSPGGTSTLTLDRALPHTDFDAYVLTGQAGGADDVWRRYAVTDPDVAAALARQSTYPFGYHLASGPGGTMTSTPVGSVLWGSGPPYSEAAAGVAVDVATGTVVFGYPTFLAAGGRPPPDVRALVPVYVESNEAVWPADSGGSPVFGGTLHSVEGVDRTLVVTARDWRDPGQLADLTAYAHDLYDSVSDTAVEGEVAYMGLYEDALGMGLALNVAGSTYTTGWEGLDLPVVECQLEWNADGLKHLTTMRCSNRRAHFSAEAFLHPARTGLGWDFGGSVDPGAFSAGLAGLPDANRSLGGLNVGDLPSAGPAPTPDVPNPGADLSGAGGAAPNPGADLGLAPGNGGFDAAAGGLADVG